MTAPKRQPGQTAWVRTTMGAVLGPLVVDVVEVVINRSGQFVRYRFDVDPKLGYAGNFPIGEERVFASEAAARGTR